MNKDHNACPQSWRQRTCKLSSSTPELKPLGQFSIVVAFVPELVELLGQNNLEKIGQGAIDTDGAKGLFELKPSLPNKLSPKILRRKESGYKGTILD